MMHDAWVYCIAKAEPKLEVLCLLSGAMYKHGLQSFFHVEALVMTCRSLSLIGIICQLAASLSHAKLCQSVVHLMMADNMAA